jgi:hypothetical protein
MFTAAAATTTATSPLQAVLSLLLLGALIGAYFIPTIIALMRHLDSAVQVALLNFLLGWTMIGWIIALIWAAKPAQPAPRYR